MDPTNRKAANQLMALEQSMNSKEESSTSYLAAPSNENNFDMIEVQQLTPPNESLPTLTEEDEEW